jgi:hypothetical protein
MIVVPKKIIEASILFQMLVRSTLKEAQIEVVSQAPNRI